MNDNTIEKLWMLGVWVALIVLAFKEQPYLLAAAIAILVIKQLGRINTTLRGKP